MPTEIERKFLVKNSSFLKQATKNMRITQGFLNSQKERVVRVRISDTKAWLTVKGASNASGMSRFEWEKEIGITEAQSLLALCEPGIIDKTRYLIPLKEHLIEVDVFDGENTGLIVAEIELKNEKEIVLLPDWIGKEVTNQAKYYNSNLSKLPFKEWNN